MLEKDQFEQFLSKSFENQTEAVRPDLWSGVQAKMVSSGVVSTVATKSVSILTKWILGSIAVGSAATISAVVLFNNNEDPKKELPAQKTTQEISVDEKTETKPKNEIANFIRTENNNSNTEQNIQRYDDLVIVQGSIIPNLSAIIINENEEKKIEEKEIIIPEENKKEEITEKKHDVKEELINPIVLGEASVTNFPNFFSPNGDGNNDYYKIESINISYFHVIIMNQNNKIVFESSDPNFKWDGEFAGEKATNGTFACIVTGTDPQGKKFKEIQLFEIK